MESTIFDFSTVESTNKGTDPLMPGQYVVESIEGEFVAQAGKTPYIKTFFYNGEGKRVNRNFYVTPKAMSIFQGIHEDIMGKPIVKSFTTAEAVANYFIKIFEAYSTKKTPNRVGMIVGRKTNESDGKVYSKLIDFNFLVNLTDTPLFEEKEYTEEYIRGNKFLDTVDTYKAEQTSDSRTVMSSPAKEVQLPDYGTAEDDNDLPF